MSWTDERVDLLRTMWNDGRSASQIAKALGSVTRNAVIGKVHRLGLSNRAGSAGKDEEEVAAVPVEPEAPVVVEVPVAVAVEEPPPEPEPPVEIRLPARDMPRRPGTPGGPPLAGGPQPPQEPDVVALANLAEIEKRARRLDLMQLTERTCKWPIGDPATTNFWFCGLPSQAGKPYCDAHVAVAFQPMSTRRDRRPSGR